MSKHFGSSAIEEELKDEYDRFIEFGNLLDRKMRQYIIQYIQRKFNPEAHLLPELEDRYFEYLKTALDNIFLIDGLIDLTNSNPQIKKQVILDTLYWLRKSYKKVRVKNPYEEELQRLEGWAVTPLHVFVKRWTTLPGYLSSLYTREELDSSFFADKFKTLIQSQKLEEISPKEQQQIEMIFHDLLAQWDALLHAKILDFQLAKFDEEQESFVELLSKKVEEYQRFQDLINPFTDYFGWDFSRKLWKDTSFDVLQHYDELLANEASIKELADLLGNMREAEIELLEEKFDKTIIRQEWQATEDKSEIVGVQESDDLSNMLSGEISLLSDPATELLFLKKYADKQLLTFRYEDQKLVRSKDHETEINQRIHQKEKGPFIICVDTSESMYGRPEQIAKVITLAILKMSMQQNRKAFLINFSVGINTLDLHDIANTIDDIAAFLSMSFHGGTDATLALYEALKQLGTHDYEEADILMVSDFIMHKLDDDVFQQIRYYQQNKGTQFHCLTIGRDANPEVLHFFDTNWVYDPKDKGIIRSLTEGFQNIMERY